MARRSKNKDFALQIAVAANWARRAMVEDRSILTDRALWTAQNVLVVRKAFVERPDEGGDSFIEKLQGQLRDVPPAVQQLMAEMVWITYLFPSNVTPEFKNELVRTIWEMSGELVPRTEYQREGILRGVGSGGPGFLIHQWMELVFLVLFTEAIKALPPAERNRVFSDYDRFIALVETVPENESRQLCHMLRFLFFPDRVERIASNGGRNKVLASFRNLPRRVLRTWGHREFDDALLQLRRELEQKHPGVPLDFYDPPLAQMWLEEGEPRAGDPIVEEYPAPHVSLPQVSPPRTYTIDEASTEIFMAENRLAELLSIWRRKRNLVLQGPPGVGKTFVARRLAWLLRGARDAACIETVQFHPSMTYEDFVIGLRPNQSGQFMVKPGRFHRFCRRAQEDPGRTYVFVIDEINRGNLAKIFGELLMLIEADKRGPDHAIPLAYDTDSDLPFFLPENLFLLGTMNTADRSLALVDYALRRRFAFVDVAPEFGATFQRHLVQRGCPESRVKDFVSRIAKLNESIAADTRSLGPGYRIGHSYFCATQPIDNPESWFHSIVHFEIRPLLEEYWMDEPKKVDEAVNDLLA